MFHFESKAISESVVVFDKQQFTLCVFNLGVLRVTTIRLGCETPLQMCSNRYKETVILSLSSVSHSSLCGLSLLSLLLPEPS